MIVISSVFIYIMYELIYWEQTTLAVLMTTHSCHLS